MWNNSDVIRDLVAVELLQHTKSTLGSNITFKTNFDFTHTSFEVVQASISLQLNTLHFFICTALNQTDETILLTLCLLNSCLTFTITLKTSQDLFVLLVIWISTLTIHYNHQSNRLWLFLVFISLSKVTKMPTHRCGHIIDWVIVRPDDDIHKKSTVTDLLESDHYCTKSYFIVSVSKPSTLYRTVINIANIDRQSLIAEIYSFQSFHLLKMQASSGTFCAL